MSTVFSWVLQVAMIIMLIGSASYISYRNDNLRIKLDTEKATSEKVPLDKLQEITLKTEIARRQEEIDKIRSFIVDRKDLVQVVSYVEERASDRGIKVQVPTIKEKIILDPVTNAPLPPSGPIQDLLVTMNATGNPDDIINFLYDLEHSPYLLRFTSWDVSVDPIVAEVTSGGVQAPSEDEPKIEVEGEAVIEAVITVWRDEEGTK